MRSRATGLYGETLLSGQVSDRASPATGDYVRSDMSEEPQQPHAHGRSTRAANRGTTNGRHNNRTVVSDDDEDATSWDGGDEDEDEPEQMDLDDDEDEQAEDSLEEDDEPQTLVVTLRVRPGSFDPENGASVGRSATAPVLQTNGVDGHDAATQPTIPALAGPGTLGQPEDDQLIPAPVPPPAQPSPPPQPTAIQQPPAPLVSNSIPQPVAAQAPQMNGNPTALPKLDGMFPGIIAPYPPVEQEPSQFPVGQLAQQPPQFPVADQQQQPFKPTLPNPTPASSSWQ